MPAPINVTLRGYLDFFGLKNGGMNPQMPAAYLQPTMEMQRWYLESRVQEYEWSSNAAANFIGLIPITSTAPTNISDGVNIIVPQHEVWVVLPGTFVAWSFAAVASQTCDLSYTYQGPTVDSYLPMGETVGFNVSTAAQITQGHRVLKELVWLPPGVLLKATALAGIVGAGAILRFGTLRLVRLRI